jgi:hypothetical protein
MYTAIAFNEPNRLSSELEEIHDKTLTPRERWRKGMAKMKCNLPAKIK